MTKLNQLLAIEKGLRTQVERDLTDVHKRTQKEELYSGQRGVYRPYEEEVDGHLVDKQPEKVKLLQHTVVADLAEIKQMLARMYDVVATKDMTNTRTAATVRVDGHTLLENVPVSFLLYLEKQLNDLETFVRKLPVLPLDKQWIFDPNEGCWVTEPVITYSTKKIPKVLLKAAPTPQHPAQTEVYHDNLQVGEWSTVSLHGGIAANEQRAMLGRITKVKDAVKFAREEANSVTVEDVEFGEKLFKYLWE